MGQDVIGLVADERLIDLAIDVKMQLEKGAGTRPILWLLSRARNRASAAFVTFKDVDPNDSRTIIALQNDVLLYDNLVQDVRTLLVRAREADSELREQERAEMAEITGANYTFEDADHEGEDDNG